MVHALSSAQTPIPTMSLTYLGDLKTSHIELKLRSTQKSKLFFHIRQISLTNFGESQFACIGRSSTDMLESLSIMLSASAESASSAARAWR